jgi:Protein of unknown function (DUF2786).
VSDKIQERIALLLNKAESTTAHEAEALREAAEKLMQKYLIDQSVIDERRAKQGKASEKIVEERIDFTGTYRGEMLHLCSNVVRGLGTLRAMQYTGGKGKVFSFYLVGFESDVEQAKLLINSLQLQAAVAVRAWWKDNSDQYSWDSSYNQEKARRSFVHGFGSGVGVRMVQNRNTIVKEETSTGTELVLVARKDRVDSYMDAKTGLRRGRARSATAGGYAAGQGYEAGKQANTGEKGLGHTKSIGR